MGDSGLTERTKGKVREAEETDAEGNTSAIGVGGGCNGATNAGGRTVRQGSDVRDAKWVVVCDECIAKLARNAWNDRSIIRRGTFNECSTWYWCLCLDNSEAREGCKSNSRIHFVRLLVIEK